MNNFIKYKNMKSLALEEKIKELISKKNHTDFIYDLMQLYDIPKATIARLKKGALNRAKQSNQIFCKKVFFEHIQDSSNLLARIDTLANDPTILTQRPRFIIVTDYKQLFAKDIKTKDTLDTSFADLWKHSEFFLPWAGKERYSAPVESMADVKAAEKMAKIYDEIYHHNKDFAEKNNHALNVFLTRLLFCFFAEDTWIFPEENQFSKALVEHTNEDGSDLREFFTLLFEAMDVNDPKEKAKYPSYISKFPYVNGSLFSIKSPLPVFTTKARQLMIECGKQNWREINPDIFGSMFQAVKIAEVRSGLGQHYTSIPNIMKVIKPLFMDELEKEFDKAYNSLDRLNKLQKRLSKIRVFDPACGSGNFLIIAYKQLRLLELKIIKRIGHFKAKLPFSEIKLTQFYGIEIDDFACEIARLSLWLAEHQINRIFFEEIGTCRPTLPLPETGHIVCGNALRMNWEEVCPKYILLKKYKTLLNYNFVSKTLLHNDNIKEEAEVYILGNPPYMGARKLSKDPLLSADMHYVFNNKISLYKNLDYIACWFSKGVEYISNSKACLAFVTTNSINQGEQVSVLWPNLLNNAEIHFAYKSFKWANNAKHNAGVTCNIIGMKKKSNSNKYIYNGKDIQEVEKINAYLLPFENVYVYPLKKKSISSFPPICFGSMPNDNNGLLQLTMAEVQHLSEKEKKFIRPLLGGEEFLDGIYDYCLWITDDKYQDALKIPWISERIEKVRIYREASSRKETQKLASVPYKFGEIRYKNSPAILIPATSTERRQYIPIGFISPNVVIKNSANAIYDAKLWHFGVLTSRMHMVWVRTVGGRLKTDYRYSAELCYNTFPFPKISEPQKKRIELCAKDILAVREKYSENTMEELYDPDKMPMDLLKAHESLDLIVESCYHKKPFESDEQRIKLLFKMYELMINNASEDDLKQLELL